MPTYYLLLDFSTNLHQIFCEGPLPQGLGIYEGGEVPPPLPWEGGMDWVSGSLQIDGT